MLIFSEGKKENSEKNQNLGYLTKWIFFVEILILVSGYVYALAHIWNGPSLDVIRALAWTLGIISLGLLLLLGYFSLYPQKRLFSFYLFAVMFGVSFLVLLNSSKTIIYNIKVWQAGRNEAKEQLIADAILKEKMAEKFKDPLVIKQIVQFNNSPIFIAEDNTKIQSLDILFSNIQPNCLNESNFDKCISERQVKMDKIVKNLQANLTGKALQVKIDPEKNYYKTSYEGEIIELYWTHLYYDGRLVDLNFSI